MLIEKNVTQTAKKLYLSQSAISMGLGQLRKLLKDPLFIRQGFDMVPTDYALQLQPLVQEVMQSLAKVFIEKDVFNPQQSTREFKLGTSEYTQSIFLPVLLNAIAEESATITINAVHFRLCSVENPFEKNRIDVGVGIARKLPKEVDSKVLFYENPVYIGHKKHEIFAAKQSEKNYLAAKQIQWCCDVFNVQTVVETYLAKHKVARETIIKASDFLSCLLMLKENKDYLSILPARLAQKVCPHFDLRFTPLEQGPPQAPIALFWQKTTAQDPGISWLIAKIEEAAKQLAV